MDWMRILMLILDTRWSRGQWGCVWCLCIQSLTCGPVAALASPAFNYVRHYKETPPMKLFSLGSMGATKWRQKTNQQTKTVNVLSLQYVFLALNSKISQGHF